MINIFSILGTLSILAAFSSLIFSLIEKTFKNKDDKRETIEERVKNLSNSLLEATKVINQIEEEIEDRKNLAKKLQKDIKTYNQLKKLNQSQVEAITQVLRNEIQNEAKHSFKRNVIVNFVFFMLGAFSTYMISILL